MAVRLIPVHDAAAMLRVDFHVHRTMHIAAVFDACSPDSLLPRVAPNLDLHYAVVFHEEGNGVPITRKLYLIC